MNNQHFHPGKNIAIKVPKYKYEETVEFYKNVIQLEIKEVSDAYVTFQFGEVTLWVDCMENYSQSDVWLEVYTTDEDFEVTEKYLESHTVPRRDEIEEQSQGLWISDPAGTIIRVGKS